MQGMVRLSHHWRFFKGYLNQPRQVGAISASSRALAVAISKPYVMAGGPCTVLEVGAGTGAVTKYLGEVLRATDRLDICEMDPGFADILANDVLTLPFFSPAVTQGRVRLLRIPIQELEADVKYDFIISGLPLTAFALRDVRQVMHVLRRALKPDGVLSYFEYIGIRRASSLLALGPSRRRLRLVNAYLSRNISRHQFESRAVLQNFPPAHARHLRFNGHSPAR